MSAPSTPVRNSLSVHPKRQRNTSFSLKSDETPDESDKSRKFFTTWRTACDKTKDKTRELFKRTLSWKGQDYPNNEYENSTDTMSAPRPGWSVHIWTTWIKRPSAIEDIDQPPISLSIIQQEKLSHFFYYLLDTDHDDLICSQDFDNLADRLSDFAGWSTVSTEYSVLKQIQQEFIRTFITPSDVIMGPASGYIELDDWLRTWSCLLKGVHKFDELPFWLQQLPKMFFLIINKSGDGILKREELKRFFTSVIGLHNVKDEEIETVYNSWNGNGDFQVKYSIYELCFINWLLCQNPNGPGHWLFGKCSNQPACFPIDYSAMNATIEDLETYNPDHKSNRYSVIV